MSQKVVKLTGRRIKTRKWDEKEKYDPFFWALGTPLHLTSHSISSVVPGDKDVALCSSDVSCFELLSNSFVCIVTLDVSKYSMFISYLFYCIFWLHVVFLIEQGVAFCLLPLWRAVRWFHSTYNWSGSPPKFNHCSLAHCQPSLKISCKSIQKVLRKIANKQSYRQTNNDENITSLAEVTTLFGRSRNAGYGHPMEYIFALWFLLSIFFFSSPNLSRRRLDVCHTSTHGVALVRI